MLTKEEKYYEKLQCRDFSKSKIQNIEIIKWCGKVLHVKVAVNNRVYTLDKYCKSFNYLIERHKVLKKIYIEQQKLNNMMKTKTLNMQMEGVQNA